MRIAIVGSRTITDRESVEAAYNEAVERYSPNAYHNDDGIVILSGGAKGVDTVAREIADEYKIDFILFKPYHMLDPQAEYSPRYFFTRNKQIADNSDVVVIVWDGKSNGTRHMIEYCKQRKKPYILKEVTFDEAATG